MGLLVRNTLAVLPAGNGHAAGRHDLYVDGSDIAGIDEAPEGFVPSEVIDGARLLTIPGLVNAHTHAYMSMISTSPSRKTRVYECGPGITERRWSTCATPASSTCRPSRHIGRVSTPPTVPSSPSMA